jgi:SAM-dependent methyltransferase
MKITQFNKEYFKFLFPQRTRLKTEYNLTLESSEDRINTALTSMMVKDYNMIKNYLPGVVNNSLDIGCGLGLIDIAFFNHYNGKINLHFLDKTNVIDENISVRGFNKEYIFYNSMDSTKDTLVSNGVKEDSIFTYEVNNDNIEKLNQNKYDLIVSLLSCGWHYSLETYVDLIKNTLTPEGILILDIRHDTGQLDYAKEHFELLHIIVNTAESKHTGGTIGDRYIFKNK